MDCAAEFRAFWLSTKLGEDPEATHAMAAWDTHGRQPQPQQEQQQRQQQGQQLQGQGMLADQEMEQQLQQSAPQHAPPKRHGGYASIPRMRWVCGADGRGGMCAVHMRKGE